MLITACVCSSFTPPPGLVNHNLRHTDDQSEENSRHSQPSFHRTECGPTAPTSTPTVAPTPAPTSAPTPTVCSVVDEDTTDSSIGEGWSNTDVTLYEGSSGTYGYVHGNCAGCDESAGRYGFLGAEGISKTFDLPWEHSLVRVSMR